MDRWVALYGCFERGAEFEAFLVLFALLAEFAIVFLRSSSAFGVDTAAYDAEVVWAWEEAVGVRSLRCSLSVFVIVLAASAILGGRGSGLDIGCSRRVAGGCEERVGDVVRRRLADLVLTVFYKGCGDLIEADSP